MKFKLALLSATLVSACMLSGTSFAAEKYEIAVVAKVTGIPWFNRMETGVNEAAKKLDVNAYQTGPSTPDPAQQVKVIEEPKTSTRSSWYQTMPRFLSQY